MTKDGIIKNVDIYKGWIIMKSSRKNLYVTNGENVCSGFKKDLNKLKEWIDSKENIKEVNKKLEG